MVRTVLLAVGLWCLPALAFAQSYIVENGTEVDFDQARRAHRHVLFGAPAHPGRLAIEQTITLVLGSTWYWVYKDLNARDWDLEPTPKNFGRRFYDPSMFRFDTNRFFVNQGHVLAGSVHYAIPRNNELGVFASLGVGIVTSALWEWIFEYREYVSLNDLVVSPYGGQALGEVTYKLGEIGDRQGATLSWPARAITYPFSRGRALHRALGDDPPRFPDGLGPAMTHEFHADMAALLTGAQLSEPAIGTRLQLGVADLPGYGRPGTFDTFYRDANFVSLDIEAQFGAPAVKRFAATARTDLVGWYGQALSEDAGHALRVGVGRGVWLDAHFADVDVDDLIGVVDMFGPVAELQLRRGPVRAKIGAAVYADFGSVTSLAFAETADQYAPATLRTELQEQGYYFAWGLTGATRATVDVGHWVRLSAQLDHSRFNALRGPDRVHQNDVPQRVRLRDRRTAARAEAAVRLGWADVGLRFGRVQRSSRLDDIVVGRHVDELGIAAGASF